MKVLEKAREVHFQDLRREAEKQVLVRRLPRYRWSIISHAAGKLGVLLLKLGTRLKQFDQSPGVGEDDL